MAILVDNHCDLNYCLFCDGESPYRSSRPEVFLKILQKLQENTCLRVSFLNKVAGLRPTTLLKKRLQHWCFPVNFVKFLRTPFFTENLQWLLTTLASLQALRKAPVWNTMLKRSISDSTT